MPGGDRTGPFGEGSKTGKKQGYCAGFDRPGFMNLQSGGGRGSGNCHRGGYGPGRGRGYGFRNGRGGPFWGEVPDVSERNLIENRIRILKEQLSALEERLTWNGKK